MPWTQKWDRVTSTLPWGPFYVFVPSAVPSRWWFKVYRLRPHQVFPGDHWIYATASPLFGRASWRHWVWSSNLTWLKWSSDLTTWLKLDKTLSPGRWHRRSWMLLMRKRSPASQSFPSSGVFLNPPAWYCNSLASYLTFDFFIFDVLFFHIWHFIFSYLTFDILILQSDHSPLLLLCQECSDRDTGSLPHLVCGIDMFPRSKTLIKIKSVHPQVFAKEVIEKVQELDQEKMKTEKAFHDFLPLTIVRDIKLKKVLQSRKESCGIIKLLISVRSLRRTLIAWPSSLETLSDSTISQTTAQQLRQYWLHVFNFQLIDPIPFPQLIDFMNHFYCNLDSRLEKFQVNWTRTSWISDKF